MIFINGVQSDLTVVDYNNLEEILLATMETCDSESKIITDVILNDELFSEVYPHQASDIESSLIKKLEITAIDIVVMANNMIAELSKVTTAMSIATVQIATYFRRGDDTKGIQTLQDFLQVNHDFINMLDTLHKSFTFTQSTHIEELTAKLSTLLTELMDIMEAGDYILLADIFEFELAPLCLEWNRTLADLRDALSNETDSVLQ